MRSGVLTLPMGQNVMISTSDGGNGQLVHGTVANQLVLAIDAITGTTSIQNLTAGTSEVINGYSITAPSGNLNPIGWASFQDDGQTGWEKANPSDVNLSELNLNGSRNIGTGSISLGAALAPASQFGVRPEVNFEYNLTDVDTRQGAVSITGYTLVLQVDPTSGEAQIVNPSGFDVKLDLYGILSPSGSLNADAWTPLADGDPDWDEANPASSHLVELNLTGSQQLTKMESGSPLTIGAPFTGGTQDLEFVFNVAPDLLPGDFDGDGDVDGNDFLWWQRGETPDSGSVSELADWQDNYGSIGGFNGGTFTGVVQYVSLGDGLATVTQVPEPACWLLVWTGVMGLVPVQRKTGKRKTGK